MGPLTILYVVPDSQIVQSMQQQERGGGKVKHIHFGENTNNDGQSVGVKIISNTVLIYKGVF